MMKAEEINANLAQCCGTEDYHKHWLGFFYTDGVKFLSDNAEAHWLLDIIGSYQPKCRKDNMLRDMQFWTLKVNADKTATLTCERDSGDVAFRKEIPFTYFPLAEVKIWVELGSVDGENACYVAMLPSER
jgi:hypothetical protein